MISHLLWYCRSDVELKTETVWGLDNKERIDGFYFRSKKPFSRAYQWHGTLSLVSTYPLLSRIEYGIKNKKNIGLVLSGNMGTEKVILWKGSLKKAEKLMLEMISELQKQY